MMIATRELASFLYKQFKILIEKRNLIVHGHWWVSENVIKSSTDDTHGFRRSRRKDGMIFESLPAIDELKRLAARADKLHQALVIFLTIAVILKQSGGDGRDHPNELKLITAPLRQHGMISESPAGNRAGGRKRDS